MAKQIEDVKTGDLLSDVAPLPKKRGRKPLGDSAMSNAERQALHREFLRNRNKTERERSDTVTLQLWPRSDFFEQFNKKCAQYGATPSALFEALLIFADWSAIEDGVDFQDNIEHVKQMSSVPMTEFKLSTPTRNILVKEGLLTVGDVLALGERNLLKLPMFGRKMVNEIILAFAGIAITLPR